MDELDKLLADYHASRLNYPNIRREKEDRLLGAIVTRVKGMGNLADLTARVAAIEEEMIRRKGGRPKAEAA